MKIKHYLSILLLSLVAITVKAQNADALYQQAKALIDAEEYVQAIPKLQTAANMGHKKAQYWLGHCYDKGDGVDEDDNLAFQWYSKAAAQGHAKSQYQLGQCYRKGEGVAKDYNKAVEWYTKAAKQGNADAQYQLGKCYMKGRGVTADQAKAKSWLSKAIRNPKGGDKIMAKLRADKADGDEDAIAILRMLGR